MSDLARFFMIVIAVAFLHWLNAISVRSPHTAEANSHLAASHS